MSDLSRAATVTPVGPLGLLVSLGGTTVRDMYMRPGSVVVRVVAPRVINSPLARTVSPLHRSTSTSDRRICRMTNYEPFR